MRGRVLAIARSSVRDSRRGNHPAAGARPTLSSWSTARGELTTTIDDETLTVLGNAFDAKELFSAVGARRRAERRRALLPFRQQRQVLQKVTMLVSPLSLSSPSVSARRLLSRTT